MNLELRTKKEEVFMLNNKILFYRNLFSLVRALISNIFHFDKLSIKIFETYATFRKIFINFMRAREFINKPTIQKNYRKIAQSIRPDLVVYLRNQPQDQEFEKVIQDMTLAHFSTESVDCFVSQIFNGESKIGGHNNKGGNNQNNGNNGNNGNHGNHGNNGGGGGYQAKHHNVPFTPGPNTNNMVPNYPPQQYPNNNGYVQPNQGYPQQPNQGYPQQPNQGFPQQPNQGYPQQPPYVPPQNPVKQHEDFPIDLNNGQQNDYGMNPVNPPSEKPVEGNNSDNHLAKMSDEKFDAALDEFINGLKDL